MTNMKERDILKKWTYKKSLIVLLLIQLMFMVFWGNAKKGFFVDELWSYGLANSYYHPHIFSDEALEDKWVDEEYLSGYITVGEGERFCYDSVIYNMSNDAHPPVYFMVLHTVCSLFPGTFSKWYGIIPNMLYFLMAQLLLYRLSGKIFKNKWLALLPCAAWGFSSAAISFVLFIRMYMLSTMCGLLTLNLHLDLMEKSQEKRPVLMWFAVLAISFLGYMCHYFYFIFAFFLSAFYMLFLLVRKNWKKMAWYASAMGGSLLLTALVFPAAYVNLFGNQYTQNAASNVSVIDFLYKLYQYVKIVTKDLFINSSILLAVIILVVLAALVLFIRKTMKNKQYRERQSVNIWFFWMCAGTVICYFVLSVKIAPSYSNRYVSTLYPLIFLLLIWLIHIAWGERKAVGFGSHAYGKSHRRRTLNVTMLAGVILIVIGLGSQSRCVDFVYASAESNEAAVEPYIETDVYFFTYNFYKVTEKIPELEGAVRVRAAAPQDWRIEEALAEHDAAKDHLMIYVDPKEGLQKEILEQIIEDTEYTQYRPVEGYQYLYDGACMAYLVY